MRVNFIEVKDLEHSEVLPYNWNVAVYWHKEIDQYVLQVIKKKGYNLGSSYMPKTYAHYNLTKKQLDTIEPIVSPTMQYAKVFSLGRFANFIGNYAPLKKMSSDIVMYLPSKENK